MKFYPFVWGASVVAMSLLSSCNQKPAEVKIETDTDSLSYAYGMLMGNNLSKSFVEQEVPIKKELFLAAITAAMNGDSTALKFDEKTASGIMENYGKKRQADDMKKMQEESVAKKATEEQWFAQNVDNKPNIQKTPSGLRYEVITEGKGAKPTISDKVKVHYHGTLIDGSVFDSSVERGEPISFPVGGVIPGWTEALQLMPVGSKWKLYIPFELAYGPRPAGKITPYSTLTFEVELLGIEK